MKTTVDFLNELSTRYGGISDYRIAKMLELSQQSVSSYRTNKSYFDDETAVKVAGLLGYEPAFVMACAHAERAARGKHDGTMKVWADIAARYAAGLAAVAFCTLGMMPESAYASTASGSFLNRGEYTLCATRKRRKRTRSFLLSQFWTNSKNRP